MEITGDNVNILPMNHFRLVVFVCVLVAVYMFKLSECLRVPFFFSGKTFVKPFWAVFEPENTKFLGYFCLFVDFNSNYTISDLKILWEVSVAFVKRECTDQCVFKMK